MIHRTPGGVSQQHIDRGVTHVDTLLELIERLFFLEGLPGVIQRGKIRLGTIAVNFDALNFRLNVFSINREIDTLHGKHSQAIGRLS